jgi:hypothetical protein
VLGEQCSESTSTRRHAGTKFFIAERLKPAKALHVSSGKRPTTASHWLRKGANDVAHTRSCGYTEDASVVCAQLLVSMP